MSKYLRFLGFAMIMVLVADKKSHAQADYVPPLSGSPLAQWQIQGEYFGCHGRRQSWGLAYCQWQQLLYRCLFARGIVDFAKSALWRLGSYGME
jgi:hypothetical protein